MSYVITCGDEGVQINQGTRLGIVGAGLELEGFSQVVKILKKLFGKDLRIAANSENAWVKQKFDLSNWEQTDATSQQKIEALADSEGLLYAGIIPFSDPRELKQDIKAHMVRPHNVHIANRICFTCGGGEQTYHLGQYVISADWVSDAPKKLVKDFIQTQVDFYKQLAGNNDLIITFHTEGELGDKKAAKNQKIIEDLGFSAS